MLCQMDSCGGSQKRTIGSANQSVEMEVEWMHTEEGFLCHRETNFDLEPPRTVYRTKTEKELEENDRGGS